MYIKSAEPCREKATTLVEMMVAVGLFSISGMALATIFLFSVKSFAAMTNYANLDRENRSAMDLLTREVRQAQCVTAYSSNSTGNSLTLSNQSGSLVTFSFSSANKELRRAYNGGGYQVLLTNCDLLNFSLFMRPPQSNDTYALYPPAIGTSNWQKTVKVVQLTWKTSRSIPAGPLNSENIQTARIVMRNQQD